MFSVVMRGIRYFFFGFLFLYLLEVCRVCALVDLG